MIRYACVVGGACFVLTLVLAVDLMAVPPPIAETAPAKPPGEQPKPDQAKADAEQPKPDPALMEKVEQILKQLGDSEFKVREKASKELEELGPTALPLLREAVKNASDPEVKRRLEGVIPNLERVAALSPTKITLSLKDKSIQDAAKELTKQSGYTIQVFNNGLNRENRAITLELKDTPFWEALDQVCEAGGVFLAEGYYGGNNATIALQYGDSMRGIGSFQGPFRVTAKGFNYYKNVQFDGPRNTGVDNPIKRSETLSINLTIGVEPKSPLLSAGQPSITEALDDLNQSMVLPSANPNPAGQSYSYYGNRTYMHQVTASLAPSQGGKKLKSLKGTIPIQFVSAQRPKIVVEQLQQVKKQTYRDNTTTMTIEEVTQNGGQVSIRMSISEGKLDAQRNDYTWMNTLQQRMEVLDAKGNKYQCYGMSEGSNNGNSATGTWMFGPNGPALGAPAKFIYYEWTTMSHSVPFEFKDLPLP